MEKKSKKSIVIGAVTLLLVTLTLLGLTYAYYKLRIKPNEEATSVTGFTNKLEITYKDGNGLIQANDAAPGSSYSKTFTVTNTGNESASYLVILEDIINEFNKGEATRGKYNDWTYELWKITYVAAENGSYIMSNGNYTEVEEGTGRYNLSQIEKITRGDITDNNKILLTSNNLAASKSTHYQLILNYKNLEEIDQSDDMGQSLSVKVNITDVSDLMDNQFAENTLAYNLLTSAHNNTYIGTNANGSKLLNNSETKVAAYISSANEKVIAPTNDDYGISYYYRGSVEDNYVNFANMCWRIVRIQGDGSIKLILEDKDAECNSADYTGNWNIGNGTFGTETINDISGNTVRIPNFIKGELVSSIAPMVKLLYDFQTTELSAYKSQLQSEGWCYNDKAYDTKVVDETLSSLSSEEIENNYKNGISIYYDTYIKSFENRNVYDEDGNQTVNDGLRSASLICNGTILNNFKNHSNGDTVLTQDGAMYVGALTADEIIYAGAISSLSLNGKSNTYLGNGETTQFFTLTPSFYEIDGASSSTSAYAYWFYKGLLSYRKAVYTATGIRPSVVLKNGITLNTTIEGQNGTKTNPYVIATTS